MVITFKDVSFRYTDKNLLDKVSFSITDQDKTGLVGLNGTGKSTLIKLIEDEIRPQSGEIIKSGNMIISYLEQEPDIPLNTKILDYVMKNNDKDHKVNDYEAKSMLTKLKLDPEALTNNLSGGQRKRLALAKCLVTYCDFLILDEPPNHLDNDMILYLEKYLQRYNHGLFMVTHDRYFLERVCNNMLELDNGHIYTYKANYSEFLNLKALRLEREEKAEKKLKRLLKNELDFALIETTPLHQLKKIAFYQDELVIVVHQKHPLLKVKDLKELEHFDYYSREKGSSIYELVHSYFISHDLDIVPTIECTNPHALIELVKQNDGFTILPYSLVKESKEITYLKNNDFQIQRTYHIVMHKDKKLLPLYQEIFELIKKKE